MQKQSRIRKQRTCSCASSWFSCSCSLSSFGCVVSTFLLVLKILYFLGLGTYTTYCSRVPSFFIHTIVVIMDHFRMGVARAVYLLSVSHFPEARPSQARNPSSSGSAKKPHLFALVGALPGLNRSLICILPRQSSTRPVDLRMLTCCRRTLEFNAPGRRLLGYCRS